MRFLITGITGHVAPHLAKLLLKEGHSVVAISRETSGRRYDLLDVMTPEELESIEFFYGDFCDLYSLAQVFENNRFDGVFHLGAQSHPPTSFKFPILTAETNILGTMNLVECLKAFNPDAVLCNVSTSEVYGDTCKDVGTLYEDMSLYPSNPYGWSKMAAERYVRQAAKNGIIKGFSTRAFSHLAPRRGKNFSISWDAYHLALMSVTGDKDRFLPVGNLKTKRVVVDARDVCKAYYQLMINFTEEMNGESFNVCGPIESVKQMQFFTDKLIEISGLDGVTQVIDERVYRPIDIKIQVGSTEKLNKYVDWKPEIPIEQTLTDVFNYWVRKLENAKGVH